MSITSISSIFCAAVGVAYQLVCLEVGLAVAGGGDAECVVWYAFTVGRLQ